jgi:hypothetical protein
MESQIGRDGLEQQDGVDKLDPNIFDGFAQPIINKIYDEIAIPTSLFHYTSSAGLIGIITQHKLWFSDASFMNDGSEATYGVRLASFVIDDFLKEKSDAEKQAGEVLKREIETAMRHFQPIIFCMSARNNLLNQWRDYGKDIVPYCIEFDVEEFERWKERECNFGIFLTKIVYDLELQQSLIRELLASIYTRTKEALGDREHFDDDEGEKIAVSAAVEIVNLIARFKNFAFDAEDEWRAISYRPNIEGKASRSYRSSSLGAVPYYEWFSAKKPPNLPIKSVTVGPSPYAQVSDLALKQLLYDNGYNVETRYSTIPIRRG